VNAALKNRITRLEGSTSPPAQRNALVVIRGTNQTDDEIVGLWGWNEPPMAHEPIPDYLARVDTQVRSTRGNAIPMILIACYAGDIE
jgi:hypothetical protein